MGNDTRDSSAGISFRDVADLARRVGKEGNGRVHFELHLPVREGHGVVMEVRAAIKRRSERSGEWLDVGGVSGRWPSGASSTFAGLLFRLAYELGAKLDEEQAEAERATNRQLRLL